MIEKSYNGYAVERFIYVQVFVRKYCYSERTGC